MTEQVKTAGEPLIRIVHPSDFSKSSRVAFAHALKIALQSNAELELVHVQRHKIGSERTFTGPIFQGCGLLWRVGKFCRPMPSRRTLPASACA